MESKIQTTADTEDRLVVARGGCVGRSVSKWQRVSKVTDFQL